MIMCSTECSYANDDLIYCPPQIVCETTDDVNSCDFDGEFEPYWDFHLRRSGSLPVIEGSYHLSYVSAPHHTKEPGYALCIYTHETVYRTVSLRSKPEFMLEVFELSDPQWRSDETWWECKPKQPYDCPMSPYPL